MNIKEIKSKINKHDVISFDIFDTLLLRPYIKPVDLFTHIEFLKSFYGFKENRVKAEQVVRQIHSNKEEITLDEIYEELQEPFRSLKDVELEFERKLLQANPEVQELFEYAKSLKKRIIITSDMYLPKNFLHKVLHEKGYFGFSNLYLSSDIGKTKYSGHLYDYILKKEKVHPNKILHIGDNVQSDILMAEKKGIHTYHYPKVIDVFLKNNIRAQKFYNLEKDWLGASILLGTLSIGSLYKSQNYWINFGFNYAGPVIFTYMKWLNNQLNSLNISDAMFVARDGYTLQKVFDILKTSDIKTHYFYTPRIINLACNLNYKDYMNVDEAGGMVAINGILEYFKEKNDFLKQNTPIIRNCAEGDAFIQKHFSLFKDLAQKEKRTYQKYLNQFKVKSKNVALIDTCSTQLSAQKALSMGLTDKEIYGFYWFTWEGAQFDKEKYKTRTFQETHAQEFVDWNIMELFMTAPTPPAEKIEKGKVIFKKVNPMEKERIKIYPALSQGIVDFAKFTYKIFGDLELFFTDRDAINWTNILCTEPTRQDIEQFKTIQHAWDINHTSYIPLPAPWFTESEHKIDEPKEKFYHLFNKIPILWKKSTLSKRTYYLLNVLKVMTVNIKREKETFKLCSFIPLLLMRRSKISDNNFITKIYFLKLIPFIKITTKTLDPNIIKKRIYFLGIKILSAKRISNNG